MVLPIPLGADKILNSSPFAWVLHEGGGQALKLRHSCVVQLARAECTVPEIASISGIAVGSATTILSTSLPRDTVVALNDQRKRGIVEIRRTTEASKVG